MTRRASILSLLPLVLLWSGGEAVFAVDAVAPSAPAASSAAELVKTNRNNLVFVSGADGAGSGFIATLAGVNYLFTNAHVAAGIKSAGFKSLDGSRAPVGAPSIAVGHDILRMQLPPGGAPLEIMSDVDQNASIGDDVVVLGNAEGGGVINTIKGKIVGLGPDLVEIDAPFVPGNSGSPIIHLASGKVIGVATYLLIRKYDPATKQPVRDPVIRHFGFRLDSVKVWQPVQWGAFYAQAAEMQNIETLTQDLQKLLIDLIRNHRITPGLHTNPVIKRRIDDWESANRKRLSPVDAASLDQNFFGFLKVACQSDVAAARQHMTYDYFAHQLDGIQQERTEMAGIFDKIVKEIQPGR